MDALTPIALVAVLGGTWGWAWLQRRRFRAAIAEAVARLDGRFEPETHTSGGTLYGRSGGRDVVFVFRLASSLGAETTTAIAILKRPVREPFLLKGGPAVSRAPRLGSYASWFGRVRLGAEASQLWAEVPGVVRDAARLVELASAVAALAAEVERA